MTGAVGVAGTGTNASASDAKAKPILVFDLVETILDTTALSPVLTRIFHDEGATRAWLDNLFIYSEAMTIIGSYVDAGAVGIAVLEMMAKARGVVIDPQDLERFKQVSGALPPYADVAPALRRLREQGYRLVALSNSPSKTCEVQLTHAGIRGEFERIFSIDDGVRRYKPARETYLSVAQVMGVVPADLWLVSCHAFDVMGAKAAGLRAVFVSRAGNASFGLAGQPDAVLPDLGTLPVLLSEVLPPKETPEHGVIRSRARFMSSKRTG